jgi:hypothetical protein
MNQLSSLVLPEQLNFSCLVQFRLKHRLSVLENGFLRAIFVSKRDEVTGGWRKLHSEKINILYPSPNIMRWTGHIARISENRRT